MIYNFKDIFNTDMYNNSRILVILGKYSIFNNIVVGKMKDQCKAIEEELSDSLASEFGIDETQQPGFSSNSVDMSTFMTVYNIIGPNGKWFCREDYSNITKNQRDWILRYGREPQDNGRLVIVIEEYKDFKAFADNKLFRNSMYTNAIRLTYPNKKTLGEIAYDEFIKLGFKVAGSAIDLFVYRMSDNYEDYLVNMADIADAFLYKKYQEYEGDYPTIEYAEMADAVKHIENFNIDNFIDQLIEANINEKVNKKKIYTILYSLKAAYGAIGLVNKLKPRINEMVEFRTFINTGYIPVKFRYFYDVVVNSIGNLSYISKQQEWKFRSNATLAAKTSLRDWIYMQMILNSVNEMSSIEEYEIALYRLVIRKELSKNTLECMVGIGDLFNEDLNRIDRIVYRDVTPG